jgi:hypothetical protein
MKIATMVMNEILWEKLALENVSFYPKIFKCNLISHLLLSIIKSCSFVLVQHQASSNHPF